MNYQIQTVYEQKTLTAMAKALRKSVRRRNSRRSHIFGWLVVALGGAAALLPWFLSDGGTINWLSLLAVAVVLLALVFEDRINGWVGGRLGLPGAKETVTDFDEAGYLTKISGAQTRWDYEKILCLCETKDYFICILSKLHCQVFDKNGFLQGNQEEFRAFIAEKTGKPIQFIK